MRRTIVEPADLSGTALAELKNWLGISRPDDDDLLIGLLQASLATCEAFTGQAPLMQMIEEWAPPRAGRATLTTRPITSLVSVELIVPGANRTALDASQYQVEFEASGTASIELHSSLDAQAVAVRVRAGIAGSWETVPAALKQGIIRLAAYYYRDRDRTGGGKADTPPPASVSALWRPWRNLRLR
ncbi:hypothetical protein [uncultured Erythrobacter sp.]|uniref:head-tail connector protein n=1 Tax=uncultured Erythrobacter sp. TaxID=263913 RepID=UPI00260BF011|nr:hypothetical protein [uncultured Erythrobacter sp.]